MRIAKTSREAFDSLTAEITEARELLVLSAFKKKRKVRLTRLDIAQITKLPINCVTPRVRALLDKGHLVVDGETIYPVTRKSHELLALAK
jgi:hypothetical protein